MTFKTELAHLLMDKLNQTELRDKGILRQIKEKIKECREELKQSKIK
tara:strand:+ start:5459 stop:5599 length:141 start_codon:yes stop_codon:yes gene_type:complete